MTASESGVRRGLAQSIGLDSCTMFLRVGGPFARGAAQPVMHWYAPEGLVDMDSEEFSQRVMGDWVEELSRQRQGKGGPVVEYIELRYRPRKVIKGTCVRIDEHGKAKAKAKKAARAQGIGGARQLQGPLHS